jgi:hypothetical protein
MCGVVYRHRARTVKCESPMKKSLIVAFLSINLVSGVVYASAPRHDPERGNGRIIWAAKYKDANGFQEGVDLGGSAAAAARQCVAGVQHYEDVYGRGVCDLIRGFAIQMHADEGFIYHGVMHIVAPVVGMFVVAATCLVGGLYFKRFINTPDKHELGKVL